MAPHPRKEPLRHVHISAAPEWPREAHDPGCYQAGFIHVADMVYTCQQEAYSIQSLHHRIETI